MINNTIAQAKSSWQWSLQGLRAVVRWLWAYRHLVAALVGLGFMVWGMMVYVAYRYRQLAYQRSLALPAQRRAVKVQHNIRVPTSDGITLATDHYYPSTEADILDASPDYPTILMRTPYGRGATTGWFGHLMVFLAQRFAEQGYHVLIQDTRGRFDSEGAFDPYFTEKQDGLDTLAWLDAQPWFNGVVGLWGPSYLGIVQWVIAQEAPQVKAIVPSITGSGLRQVLLPDDAFDLGLALRWLTLFHFIDQHRNTYYISSTLLLQQVESALGPAFQHLPIIEADKIATGQEVDFYRKWLAHKDEDDPLWKEIQGDLDIAQVDIPVHLVGGWYDFFLRALLQDYGQLRDAGRQPYLTIGPWHHFSRAFIMLDTLREGLAWFDAHLKGHTERVRAAPVRLYVMGRNLWREFESWPPPTQETAYYLHPGGRLQPQPAPTLNSDHYTYDPADPTPALGGTQFNLWSGAFDNRRLEARPDVLTYTAAPLVDGLEIIGVVRLVLYVKSSRAHTDFFGRLCDVYPNGRSMNVCDGLFRVAPSKGTPQADGSLRIEVDMWATAYYFKPGHALRLQVSSGAHPRWNRNLGSDEPFPTATQMYQAEQCIYHSPTHPAALWLPHYHASQAKDTK